MNNNMNNNGDRNSVIAPRKSARSYASVWTRTAASSCDLFILMVAIGWAHHYLPSPIGGLANVTVTFAYYAILLSLSCRTLGQRLFGQLVVTEEFGCLSVGTALRRAGWILASYILVGIPFLAILFTEKHQALHDMMTHTVVINQR
jgi:uncharacterized RDD family membrane protein YckC